MKANFLWMLFAGALSVGELLAQPAPNFKETLGTKLAAADQFSTDLSSAVRMALPGYDDLLLSKVIATTARKFAQGERGVVVDQVAIEKLMKIKVAQEGEEQNEQYSYEIYPRKGHVYLSRNLDELKPLSLQQGREELKLAGRVAPAILKTFGIEMAQLHSLSARLSLLESVQKLGEDKFSAPSVAVVDGIMSYGLRAVDGIIVEGSTVKVLTRDSKHIEGINIDWPTFRIHKGLQRFELKSKALLMQEVLTHLKQVANLRFESNVKMAVVYRPVLVGEEKVFVPSLKVGLYSRPINDKLSEQKGEAGELFFIDLMAQPLKYVEVQAK